MVGPLRIGREETTRKRSASNDSNSDSDELCYDRHNKVDRSNGTYGGVSMKCLVQVHLTARPSKNALSGVEW